MDKKEEALRRELSIVDRKLINLEQAIALFGKKQDINEYFNLIEKKKKLEEQLEK